MAKKYARGTSAWGECARSGRKMLLKDMVFDGYFPNLRVDPDWFEDRHPQERLVKVDDPVALFRPAPELLDPPTAPVLDGEQEDGGGGGGPPPLGVNLNDHLVRVSGQTGSGSQQPQIGVSMNRDTPTLNDVFPLGSLVFYKGTGQQLYVDGVANVDQELDDLDEWWNNVPPPTETDYDVRLTVLSGTAPDTGPINTWVSMAALNDLGPSWRLQVSLATNADVFNGSWLIEIRDSVTLEVLDDGVMTIVLDFEPIS